MSQVFDADSDADGEYVYHVVCHDCPTESVDARASDAEERLDEHRISTGHDIEVARLPNERNA
ncbi:hypothetical protein [Halobellus limi]|jgi:hypothetical protein|uniref:DUF1059 domain-containing protein n=1 Tax=Halobellus limi TaxID=699433 RepID=A0A1H5SY30_9EURY|nr:hypothetical protein [Halobellus limi]QCC47457.1 hypothetical protein DV707_07150 [Halobellus limi]SEF55466.1 hypothetical protein SAMN04488133_0114 [Halobellus limi]